VVEETSSPLTLPGTIGTGFLNTRVILGESNSAAAKLYGYEYRLDLSGVTLDPAVPACVTNVLQCVTNRVEISLTNAVTCRTNVVGASNVLNCVTNRIAGTNMVLAVTNSFPATNVVQCFTDAAGAMTCFTNSFAATNYVLYFTNRVPDRTSFVVRCVTNSPHYFTNIVTCTTNSVPCPASTPCIKTVSIQFGPAVAMDFDTNGTLRDLVYVVGTNGLGTVAPSAITWDDGKLVLTFSPPLCPGDSSLTVGLLSRGAPRDVPAKIKLSNRSNVVSLARAPLVVRSIDCDFSELAKEIRELRSRDILAPNNNAREGRRTALLNHVREAQAAARVGSVDDVMEALSAILDKTDGSGNDWLTSSAARKVNKLIADIAKCLTEHDDHRDSGKDDDDND
jgi:hypothetical protein